jgi:hypothetical protein
MRKYLLPLLGLLVIPAPAEARDCTWQTQAYRCVGTITGYVTTCYRNVCVYPRPYYSRDHSRESYHNRWKDRRDRDDRPGYRPPSRERESTRYLNEQCKWKDRIRVTGGDNLDKRKAELSAQDAWSSTVEVRFGTMFSDIDTAEDMVMACARKVPTSWTEKLQASGGLRHYVCEISAIPCPPEAEEQDRDSRAKRRFERRSEPRQDAPARP